jgi:hypothetical protein
MPEKFKRLSARLKRLSEHKQIEIELSIERSEGGCLLGPLGGHTRQPVQCADRSRRSTHMATTAPNIAALVRATTIEPKRELG